MRTISNLGLHPWGVIIVLLLWWQIILPVTVFARVTPEDIVNSKKEAYESRVVNYSAAHRQNLEIFSKKIVEVNKKRTDELDRIMVAQALILDEYETRLGSGGQGRRADEIEKARYWITYAHEAVAYQAAKIYIFDLSGESNITRDALNTISFFQSELNSARSKVINSQKILTDVVKLK